MGDSLFDYALSISVVKNDLGQVRTLAHEVGQKAAVEAAQAETGDDDDDAMSGRAAAAASAAVKEWLDQVDLRGNTALHLAIHLQLVEMVSLLIHLGASPVKKCHDFSPMSAAIATGNVDLAVLFMEQMQSFMKHAYRSRLPALCARLAGLPDFDLVLHFVFRSWVPLVSKLLPQDRCVLRKRGSSVRLDFSLSGFERLRWIRAPMSVIFCADTGAVLVLNRERKTCKKMMDGVRPVSPGHVRHRARLLRRKQRQKGDDDGPKRDDGVDHAVHRNEIKFLVN